MRPIANVADIWNMSDALHRELLHEFQVEKNEEMKFKNANKFEPDS